MWFPRIFYIPCAPYRKRPFGLRSLPTGHECVRNKNRALTLGPGRSCQSCERLHCGVVVMHVLDSTEPPELLNQQLKTAFGTAFFAQNHHREYLGQPPTPCQGKGAAFTHGNRPRSAEGSK